MLRRPLSSQMALSVLLVTTLTVAATLTGCRGNGQTTTRPVVRDGFQRQVEARANATIFSPLDLPAPNSIRTGSGAPGPDYWQNEADYDIDAALYVETNTIDGRATITYTNNSPDPLDYLWLHLEQNIFRPDSIGSRTSGRGSISMNDSHTLGCQVRDVRHDGRSLDFAVYDTLGRVHLPREIAPNGGTFTIDVSWTFRLPERTFRRFGIEHVAAGTIYEIAQWFPAVAVYDDVHGWNTLPYLGTGEFYTPFGDYDVRLTVPSSHLVAATGELQNPSDVLTTTQQHRLLEARSSAETVVIRSEEEVSDPASRPSGRDMLTWHFRARDCRTFAWASSDAFIYDACDLDGVLVQSMYPAEALPNWAEATQMLRQSIRGYTHRWYPYPYPVATNVSGAEGGMEYPMIIFCRGRGDIRGLYGVTTHEIGHNWFPMLLNTDERRHAWMDEGFNTFINYYSFGEWFEGEHGRRGAAEPFAAKMQHPSTLPLVTYPDQLPRNTLGTLAYEKPAVGLVMLREQILGPERFDYAFRTYIRRWAFKAPQPADFFRTMEDASGADLAWFWRGWFLENTTLDQALESVDVTRGDTGSLVNVTILNLGTMVMPADITITFGDGSTVVKKLPVEAWFDSDRISTAWEVAKPVTQVEIDAARVFPDVNRHNNVVRLRR